MITVAYVLDMRKRLTEMSSQAKVIAEQQQVTQKKWYDRNARSRSFKIGQRDLLLKPRKKNKWQCSWQGPFFIKQKLSEVDYAVEINSRTKQQRVYHVNMIKECVDRAAHLICYINLPGRSDIHLPNKIPNSSTLSALDAVKQRISQTNLQQEQQQQLHALVDEFPNLFSDNPGQTQVVTQQINITDDVPVRKPAYTVSMLA